MVTVGELFTNVKALLKSAGIDTYRFDAQCIMEDCFGARLPVILTNSSAKTPDDVLENVRAMADKRVSGEPLQYILGQWEFYGYPFKVGEGVLIPRPDTETLVEKVIDYCKENNLESPKIADLCSGSGCIAVTLKKQLPKAQVFALELSDKAYAYLNKNAHLNNADIHTLKVDILSGGVADSFENLDVIVSNPPYLTQTEMDELQTEVKYEPEMALFGGNDGLDFYRQIPKLWKKALKTGGLMAFEIGCGQENDVAELLEKENYINIEYTKDTADIFRVVSAVKKEDL